MSQRVYRHPAVIAGRVGLTSLVGVVALLSVVGLPAPPLDHAPAADGVGVVLTAPRARSEAPDHRSRGVVISGLPLEASPDRESSGRRGPPASALGLVAGDAVDPAPAPRRRCGPTFLTVNPASARLRPSRCGLPFDDDG